MVSSLTVFGQTINGTIIDGKRNEKIPYVTIQLLYSSLLIIKDTKMADVDGKFAFRNVDIGLYSIKTSVLGYGESIFNNIAINGDTILILDIQKACKYNNSINDKTCPACHQKDKAIPIVYGELNSMKGEGIKFLSGGCVITNCDPHWYCTRDRLKY